MGFEFKEIKTNGPGGRREGAGRPPGRLSDITLIARAVMEERGYNPIEALMDIAEDEENSCVGRHGRSSGDSRKSGNEADLG